MPIRLPLKPIGFVLAATASTAGPGLAQDRCEVERVNNNGNSIGNPECPQRGSLARIGGDKDSQTFLVLGERAPRGTFSLQSQNAAFDTGEFVLRDGRIRVFVSDANGQQPHSLYNYDAGDSGPIPPDPGLPPIEPPDPTDPTDPTDPGFPVDPTDPTDPGFPVDPTDPTDPGTPPDPTDPTDPGSPPDPTDPTDPVVPPDPGPPDTGSREIEEAVVGTGALPVFIDPYTITERLVGWGFGSPGGEPETGGVDDDDRRAWFQLTGTGYDESRFGRDGDGRRGEAILGIDLVRNPDLIFGLAAGWEDATADSFARSVQTDFDGYFFGPYAAYKPRGDLVLDFWLGYARRELDSQIAQFESRYDVERLFFSANATGFVERGETEIRPKFEFFWSRDETEDHRYRASGDGDIPEDYSLAFDGGTDDLAHARLSVETRRRYLRSDGTLLEPFARIGIEGYLARPNDGRVIGDNLELRSTASVTGDIEAGLSVRLDGGGRLDARVGYGNIGSDGLESFGAVLAFSLPF